MTPGDGERLLDSLRAGVPWDKAATLTVRKAARALAETDAQWAADLAAAEAEGEAERKRADGITCVHVAEPAPPAVEWPRAVDVEPTLQDIGEAMPLSRLEATGEGAEAPDSARHLSALVRLRAEAERYAPGDFGYVLLVDAKCIAAGMPPMSPWWRWSVGDFFATCKPWGIFLVGRGGGKSTTLERVAASISRYGERSVPSGQTWEWPFISVGPNDANRRINGIAAVFRADGLQIVGDYDSAGGKVKTGDGVKISRAPRGSLELVDVRENPVLLASIAGTVGNVSGPSTIGLTIDEAAKLIDARGANPLTEIVASAAQTSRGRERWRGIMSSSAFDRAGIHFQLVQQGDNESNYVARIGAQFLDGALAGFESVAAWEQLRGDVVAAETIRKHAASLRADSPLVPSWVAFPGFGHPLGHAWDGAALASRRLVEVLPEEALEGVPRILYWLRENGSLPMDRAGGVDPWAQINGLAEANAILAATARGEPFMRRAPGGDVAPMKLRGAPPGDARYAGPPMGGPWRPTGWDKGNVF